MLYVCCCIHLTMDPSFEIKNKVSKVMFCVFLYCCVHVRARMLTCTLSADRAVALLAAHTAVRSLCVHTLLPRTRVASLTLINICRKNGQWMNVHVCVFMCVCPCVFEIVFIVKRTCALPVDECVPCSTWNAAIWSQSVHAHLSGTLRWVCTLVHIWTNAIQPRATRWLTSSKKICTLQMHPGCRS